MADEKTFTKDELDAAVTAALGKVQESIDKLEGQNEKLVGELRTAKQAARAASEIKPEDLTAAEDRADKAEAALAEAGKQVKALTGERDKAAKALETEQGFTQRLLIADGLKTALIEHGVNDPDFIDSLTAKFSGQAKVVTEGEDRKATIGDKTLGDFIKEWAGSDTGKKFVAAPANSGGGAGGGGGGGSGKTILRSEYQAKQESGQAGPLNKEIREGTLKVVDPA